MLNNWGHFLYKYSVFESFYCYSATYGPISMKLCMAVKVIWHMFSPTFIKFQVLFRFYRPLVMCTRPFLNELILANQRTKFHFFSIIIDLESPEITAVVWSRLRKKPETSSQK